MQAPECRSAIGAELPIRNSCAFVGHSLLRPAAITELYSAITSLLIWPPALDLLHFVPFFSQEVMNKGNALKKLSFGQLWRTMLLDLNVNEFSESHYCSTGWKKMCLHVFIFHNMNISSLVAPSLGSLIKTPQEDCCPPFLWAFKYRRHICGSAYCLLMKTLLNCRMCFPPVALHNSWCLAQINQRVPGWNQSSLAPNVTPLLPCLD